MGKSSAIAAWVYQSGPRSVDELFSGVSLGWARLAQDRVVESLIPGSSIRLVAGVDATVVAEINSIFRVTDVIGQIVRGVEDESVDAGPTVVANGFCDLVSPERGGLLELIVDGAHIDGDMSLVLQVGLMKSRMTDEIPFHIQVQASGDRDAGRLLA